MGNLSESLINGVSPRQADDEISLAELLHHLISYWKTVSAVMFFTLITGILYIVTATPIYSTELSYRDEVGGVDMLNMVPGINYQEEQVVKELSLHLASYENFKNYLSESKDSFKALAGYAEKSLSDDEREAQQRNLFIKNLDFIQPKEEAGSLYALKLSYPQGSDGPNFLNGYFLWTLAQYKSDLVDRVERSVTDVIRHNQAEMVSSQEVYATEISNRIAQLREADQIRLAELNDRLDAEKQAVLAGREERIRILREAEQIATKLGIQKPTTPYELGRHEASRDVIYADINSQGTLPLYFMGTLALSAEREIIEANLKESIKTVEIRNIEKEIRQLEQNRTVETLMDREISSPFNTHFAELEKENTLLRSYQITTDDFKVTNVAQWAYQPDAPDSPRTAMILALALILGSILGLICAAFQALWKKARTLQTVS